MIKTWPKMTICTSSAPLRLNLVPANFVDLLERMLHRKSFPFRLHWWTKQAPSTSGTHLWQIVENNLDVSSKTKHMTSHSLRGGGSLWLIHKSVTGGRVEHSKCLWTLVMFSGFMTCSSFKILTKNVIPVLAKSGSEAKPNSKCNFCSLSITNAMGPEKSRYN